RASLGIAYERPKAFAVGADAHVMAPQSNFVHSRYSGSALAFQTGQPPAEANVSSEISVDSRTTVNGSVGGEVFFTDSIALRAGVASDRDVVATFAADGSRNSRLDWYMATLGLGTYEGPFETTYGAAFRYGLGTRQVPDHFGGGEPISVDYNGFGVMI